MDLLHNLLDTCTTLTRRVENLEQDKIAQALEITKLKQRVKKLERRNKLKVSKLGRLKKVGTTQRVDTSDDTVMDDDVAIDAGIKKSTDVQGRQAESQTQIYKIDLEHADKVLSMQDDEVEPAKLQEVVEVVTSAKLITEVVTAGSATITVVAPQLTTVAAPTLTTAPSAARRRKGVVIRDPEETTTPSTIIHTEPKSKDKGKWIMTKEHMEEEDSRALKRISESKDNKAAKKQKLDEELKGVKRRRVNVPAVGVASVNVDDVPAEVDEPSIPSPTPLTQPPPPSQDIPSTSQGRIIADMDADVDVTLKDIAKNVAVDADIEESADVQGRQAESQTQIYKIDLEHADKVLSMQDNEVEPAKLQEVVEVVTTAKLITEVVTDVSATITVVAPQLTTAAASTLTTAPSAARRRKGVVIRDPEETTTPSTIIHTEPKSKDKGKWIMVHEPQPLKKKTQIEQDAAYAREKPQIEAQARKNMMIYLRNMAGFKMDYFKGMKYDDIRLIFEKYFNSNVAFLEKTKEHMEEEDSRTLKRISESKDNKAAKKQKLDEEVVELERHLQ
nr:hypothetical protein [Tanacetum cinerariifolium]